MILCPLVLSFFCQIEFMAIVLSEIFLTCYQVFKIDKALLFPMWFYSLFKSEPRTLRKN